MTDSSVCAVDVGSSVIKAAVYDGEHRLVSRATTVMPRATDQPGRAEVDAEALWQTFAQTIRLATVRADVRPRRLALAGQMAGLVLLGHDRRPLGNVILGVDRRGIRMPDVVTRNGANSAVHTAAKLGWFLANDRRVLARVGWIGGVKEFLLDRLTGLWATDPSTASVTGLYDLAHRVWDAEVADRFGITTDQLPVIRHPAELAGPVRSAARNQCGLSSHAHAVVGIGDGPAANLASGAVGPHRLCLSTGTTVVARLMVQRDAVPAVPRSEVPGFVQHVADDWYCVGIRVERDGTSLRSADAPQRPIPAARLPDLVLPVLDGFGGITELVAVGGQDECGAHRALADQWSVTAHRTAAKDGTLGAAGLWSADVQWPRSAPAAAMTDRAAPRSPRQRRKVPHA